MSFIADLFTGVTHGIGALLSGVLGGGKQGATQAAAAPAIAPPPAPQAAKTADRTKALTTNMAAMGPGGALAGNSGTFLTGPSGIASDSLNLGKNTLLGQ